MVEQAARRQPRLDSEFGQLQRETLRVVQAERTPLEIQPKDPRHEAAAKLESSIEACTRLLEDLQDTRPETAEELELKIRAAKSMLFFDDPSSFKMTRTADELEGLRQEVIAPLSQPPYKPSKIAKMLDRATHLFGF